MTKHSPEPWRNHDYEATVVDAQGLPVCNSYVFNNCADDPSSMKQEDMDRIISCVNAMRGTSDPVAFMRQLAMAMVHLGNAEREITHWISGEEAGRQPAVCKLVKELAGLRQFGEWEENS